jgi:hypothetical protein
MKQLIFLCLFVATLLHSGSASSKIYTNLQHHYDADLPDSMTICTTPPPGPNHGFIVLLYSKDCDALDSAERVGVFSAYNVAYEPRSTAELGDHLCAGAPIRQSREKIGSLRFLRCDPVEEGGLAISKHFALRRRPGEETDWIQMDVTLLCRADHAKACDRALHDVFRRIRLTN